MGKEAKMVWCSWGKKLRGSGKKVRLEGGRPRKLLKEFVLYSRSK